MIARGNVTSVNSRLGNIGSNGRKDLFKRKGELDSMLSTTFFAATNSLTSLVIENTSYRKQEKEKERRGVERRGEEQEPH